MIEVNLQKALFERLNGASLDVTGVYDVAPQREDSGASSAFPYITIGRIVLNQSDTQTTVGHAAQIRIHTFSRSGSMLECKTIQGKIFLAMHKQVLTIDGFSNYALLREDTDCFPEGDGKMHGVCEYRALIETA
jgi:hypothetical protein